MDGFIGLARGTLQVQSTSCATGWSGEITFRPVANRRVDRDGGSIAMARERDGERARWRESAWIGGIALDTGGRFGRVFAWYRGKTGTRRRGAETMTSFSVVVTNYNYGRFVGEAIESVLAQAFPAEEIIVVDDGSTDGSAEVVRRRFGDTVKLIETENRGQLHAFVVGCRSATAEHVAFLDADDTWFPNHLSTVKRVLTTHPGVDFVIGNCERFGGAEGRYYPSREDIDYGTTRHVAVTREWIGAPTSALVSSRAFLSFLDSLPDSFLEDWRLRADDVLVFAGSILGGHKFRLGEPTVGYRVHGSNGHYGVEQSAADKQAYRDRQRRMFETLIEIGGLDREAIMDAFHSEIVTSSRRRMWERRRAVRRMRRFGILSWRESIKTSIGLHLRSMLPPGGYRQSA